MYYRDVIGNISTSHVRSGLSGVVMEVDSRFPLFGGWRTNFYQGYNVPSGPYVSVNGDGSYTLTFDAHCAYAGFPVRTYDLRVVLPESAVVVSATAGALTSGPGGVASPPKMSRRWTFFDGFVGRPIVTLSFSNIVSGVTAPGAKVSVTYTLPAFAPVMKGFYATAAWGIVFALGAIVKRVDLGLGGKAKAE